MQRYWQSVVVQGAGTVEAHEEAVKKKSTRCLLLTFNLPGPLAAAGIIKGVVAILTATLGWTAKNNGVALVLTAAGDGFFQFYRL